LSADASCGSGSGASWVSGSGSGAGAGWGPGSGAGAGSDFAGSDGLGLSCRLGISSGRWRRVRLWPVAGLASSQLVAGLACFQLEGLARAQILAWVLELEQAQGLGMAMVQAAVLAGVMAGALAQEQELAVFQTLDWVPKPVVDQVQEPAGFQAWTGGLELAGAQVQGLAQAHIGDFYL